METQTTHTNTLLTKRIMRRIYLVWMIRLVLHPILLKTIIVGILFWRSTEYISYSNVIANAPRLTDIGSSLTFARGAVMHSESMTLVLLLGVLATATWLLSDIIHRRGHFYM